MTRHINVQHFVRDPYASVRIMWEVGGTSGSTECEAWQAQGEVESLERSGYTIVDVAPVVS